MKSILITALLVAVSSAASAQAVKPHEIEDFIREDKFKSIDVSPKGTYMAITVPVEDKTVLYVIKPGEKRPTTRIDVQGKKSHVFNVTWVSDDRLIYEVGVKDQLIENPVATGELFAVNADGSKPKQLGGYINDNGAIAGRAVSKEPVYLSVINTLADDDQHVIAAVYRSGSVFTTVERVDVYTGSRLRLSEAPIINAGFETDNHGVARFASGFKRDRFEKLYYRPSADKDWELVNDEGTSHKIVYPIGFSADDSIAYLRSEEPGGPDSILAYDTATRTTKQVARDSLADPSGVIHAIGKHHIIGVYYAGAQPRYTYFDPDSAEAKAHRALQQAFPGQVVMAGVNTTAKNEATVYTYADREPGAVYSMNLTTRKVDPVLFAADWLDPDRLAPMRDVVFQARDGRKIPALLTLPVGSDGKKSPLVVYPHGGPFGINDDWGFDPTVQVLASHGYAVLQVNYRGSSGFGREHQLAGYKQWGLAMQDDLTDATRWAIGEGIADSQRICIYGASYGGYAALMGVAKEPGLYKCAVGQVGVYDPAKWKSDKSLGNDYARRFFDETMNDGDLATVSPNRLASKIKVPVFLSAGHEDDNVPVEHTEKMEAALKAAGVPVETLYFKTEGHGIYKREHKREFYGRLLTFLQKNIGGRAPETVSVEGTK
jgi:dipeptidyl aminopeptidase/acylaminoacyl peptidase